MRAASGAPRFPEGTVGSIAHGGDLAFAAVAPSARFRALGVDVEPVDAAAAREIAGLLPYAEIGRLQGLGLSRPAAVLAGFGLREALYKVAADALCRWIDHTEVEFHSAAPGLFRPRAHRPDLARHLRDAEASVGVLGGYVLAALWLPIPSSSGSISSVSTCAIGMCARRFEAAVKTQTSFAAGDTSITCPP